MQEQYARESTARRDFYRQKEKENDVIKEPENEKKSILRGFRIRFFVAVVIFAAFIYCDRMGISYANENADTIYERILEKIEFTTLK